MTAVENGQPVAVASVIALRSGTAAAADRYGRFTIWVIAFPDTLVARIIGRSPDTVVVESHPPGVVALRLRLSAIPVAGVNVYAEDRPGTELPAGTWNMTGALLASVPSAIEGDVLRSLTLVPAVRYSSLLSAQPMVRGTDAGGVGFRLDGFTLINPYHIGRWLGAVTPSAVQGVSVRTAPLDEDLGDATSGIVDVQLREGGDSLHGGVQGSFATVSAWAGGSTAGQRWFVAGRGAYLDNLPITDDDDKRGYGMHDLYGRFALQRGGRPVVQVTMFASGDRLGEIMRWGNSLVGVRAPFTIGSAYLEAWGEASTFYEKFRGIVVHGGHTDIDNRFTTVAAGAKAAVTGASTTMNLGAEVRRRHIQDLLTHAPSEDLSINVTPLSLAVFGAVEHRVGPLFARLGVRTETDGRVTAVQPIGRVGLALGADWSLLVAAGRSERLYQLIADPRPEPSLVFSDFWRPAGRGGTPVPRGDHLAVELDHSIARTMLLRASAFHSRWRGVGEVRPLVVDTGLQGFFRYGHARVYGLETELSVSRARWSVDVSYLLSWSRRQWSDTSSDTWWSHDRRHQARTILGVELGGGWRVMSLGELASPEPLTPIIGLVTVGSVGVGGVARDTFFDRTAMVPGAENTARGGWTGHFDLAVSKEVGGRGRVRGVVGLSILNLALTRVTQLVPVLDGLRGVAYRPAVDLPPIPTLTLKLEF